MNAPNRKTRPSSATEVAPATTGKSVRKGQGAPASAPSTLPTRGQKVLGALRTTGGIALALAISLGVALGARQYVRTSPRFALSEVTVHGASKRTPAEVLQQAGTSKGDNIFAVDPETARRKLLADPWIVEAHVTRRLPGTVDIEVKERKAAALVALGDTYLATRDGVIFKRLEAGDPTDLPIVTGVEMDELTDDRKGAEKNVKRALDLAAEYNETDFAPRYPLQEVHLKKDGTTSMVVGHTAITLELGQAPFRRKLEQASRVLRETERRGAKVDAILLDNDARPERVVVRMR